jgi:hypothetical protein
MPRNKSARFNILPHADPHMPLVPRKKHLDSAKVDRLFDGETEITLVA